MASGDSLHLSELRIVLLGGKLARKSSSGNTILGREEFDLRPAAQSVKRQGEVAGRQVTVVDTLGWWRNDPVESTTELVKQEIVRSVSLCPPGPHTLLLVIRLDVSFLEEERTSVEGHLQLLGERVWSHTIVLFTNGYCLGDTTIEQHIETEGKALQWLVEKCGNRYHVLNNENRGDDTQVTELLDKMEEMVAGNRGGHYEMDREILEKIEVWRRPKETRAKKREAKVMKQREIHRTFVSDSLHLSELRIVLLGGKLARKSSSGNTILGREEFDLRTAAQCVKRQGEVAGRQVTVVDTPGWWRNLPVEDTTELVKQEIVRSVSLCLPGPHTILLVIALDVAFREEEANSVEGHLQLLSERVWSHTIVLFTCGDRLADTTIEQHIETEGKALQWLVEKCGNRYHVLNNVNRGDDTQVTELLDKMEEMVAANSGDVLYPEMDGSREMNWSSEEYQTSRLPVKRARSNDFLPPSMSGDSRAERDDDSGWRSETESLLSLEKWRDGRSDLLFQESSGYGSQTSRLSHHSSGRTEHAQKGSAEEQLRSARLVFVERVTMPVLDDLLDGLLQERVINDAEMEAVKVEAVRKDRGRVIIDMVLRKGSPSCFVMKTMLAKYDPALYTTLGFQLVHTFTFVSFLRHARLRLFGLGVKTREGLSTMASGESLHLPELRIVLLGWNDAGKSSSGNTILGREEFDLRTAAQCVKRQGEVAGRQVTVVDTPGWLMGLPPERNTELVKQEIVRSVSLCPPGPHTLLLVIRLDRSFLEKHRRSVEGHLQLLSERVWSHTIVLFTHGDCLGDTTIEQHIETEGKALQWLVEKCGNRYHVLNNENRGDDTQVTELLDKMEEMVAANSGDVFYSEMEGTKYQTSRLPVKRARSMDLHPMMSGDSRAERDDDSDWRSEAGSWRSLKKWRQSRSDVPSLGSSDYGSQTSILSHHSSESNPHRSPHSRLNPEPAHSREPQGPTSPLPVTGARRMDFPPSKWRDGRSDVLSLGSSGYVLDDLLERVINVAETSFKVGQILTVTGVPNPNCDRFSINVGDSVDDIALHMDVCFNYADTQKQVVFNSCHSGTWHWYQHIAKGFPFNYGKEFKVSITFTKEQFLITLPDESEIQFTNRHGDPKYSYIFFRKVNIHGIEVI
ncbi:uncharacterized protein LOC134038535 [Osmerus eperlanus]|uniref:uncharacterized protein LOC134038535 n=1 Tax=Osmerus eperlanus TaxID=29151 RepID=UPI002E15D3FF